MSKMALTECLQPLCINCENRLVLLKVLNLIPKTRHKVKSGNLDFILCVPSSCLGMGQEANCPDQCV